MKAKILFFAVVVLVVSSFIFAGCGWKIDPNTVQTIISGPTALTVTNEPATGIYSATVFGGDIAEDRGDTFSTGSRGKYWWYLIKDDKLLSTEIESTNTHTYKFYVPGTYFIQVSCGAAIKTNNIVNGIIPGLQFYDVVVSRGQGYKETTITPHIVIDEWYPGHIGLDASRTETNPISDKIVSWEWYLDGINFSSQQEAGVPVTEGSHKIRLEIKTLFGFSQYLETTYVYKSGATSVEIKGSSGGSATGGTTGGIDNPPYNPPVDNNDDNPVIPQPVAGRDGNLDLSFNKGAEVEVNRGQTVRMPIYAYGLSDHINIPIGGIFYDKGFVTFMSIESAGDGWVVKQDGNNLAFSAVNSSPSIDTIVCYLVFKATGKDPGVAGVTWVGIDKCSAGYDAKDGNGIRGLFLRGIDGFVRVK
ncbi:MAG: hypothetical protein PHY72_04210 [Candidatus Pacebacteria bacterium]|nr:hypothetical protein [Candidatus Paceibacterota bacterium]